MVRHAATSNARTSILIVLTVTFVTFCAFYAPQPLLPLFTDLFRVPEWMAAMLISVTFVALSIGPVITGRLLQRYSPRRLLLLATAALAGCQWGFATASTFELLLLWRCLQALLFPILFTTAMTYCSRTGEPAGVASRVSLYIATTIAGGLIGRLLGGYLSSLFHWTTPFFTLGAGLLLCTGLLLRIDELQTRRTTSHTQPTSILKQPEFIAGYALIFSTFFVFAALLNALPFRMTELQPGIAESTISLAYIGYVSGLILALTNDQIKKILGGAPRTLRLGLLVFCAGLIPYFSTIPLIPIALGFVNAGGFFLLHSTLSGHLNSIQPEQAATINGYYIAIYYIAGAAGSLLPVWFYASFGWVNFLMLLLAISLVGFVALHKLQTSHR